jgi:hypothetical protein
VSGVVDYAQIFIDLQGTLEGIGQRDQMCGKTSSAGGAHGRGARLRFQAVALLGLIEGLYSR